MLSAQELAIEGVQEMTMRAVAKRAGVGIASLYRYFPDRNALLTELFRRQHQETLNALAESLQGSPTIEEGIRKCVRSFIDFDQREVALRRTLNFDVRLVGASTSLSLCWNMRAAPSSAGFVQSCLMSRRKKSGGVSSLA